MPARDILQSASGLGSSKLYVDDVFSTYLYDGNGTTQTINNGIDLAGQGGMVWIKCRSGIVDHYLTDTTRGYQYTLYTNATSAQASIAGSITSFNSGGFSIGSQAGVNTSGQIYTSWTFRNAPKFFTHTTVSHTYGTATNIDLSSLGEVGMVVAKIAATTGDWITWHRSLTAGNNLRLNTSEAQTATNAWLSVSGTTATLYSAAPTGTYVIYAWAHDASAEGFVQCGLASGSGQVELGWEPQFILVKRRDSGSYWLIQDFCRGLTATGGTAGPALYPQLTSAEASASEFTKVNSTGFYKSGSSTDIYLAIRIPNKPPTSGTEVFRTVTYTGTNTDNRLVNTGIKTDMAWFRMRSGSGTGYEGFVVGDRLRGQPWLKTGLQQAETITADGLDQQLVSGTEYGTAFSSMTGVWVGNNTGTLTSSVNINGNTTANNHIVEAFKRAPGFFDIVCYTGTGSARTVNHNLGVTPELMIVIRRNTAANWSVYYGDPTKYIMFTNSSPFVGTYWNNVSPTSTVFSLGSDAAVNNLNDTFVAHLFATLPGISKVGSYTGNGSTQTINCGFTTGARFVLIKRTDANSDWWVFDTARGIVVGNDPILFANATQAESTTNDLMDPSSVGFIVNATTGLINNTGASYIFLAVA